MWMVRAGEGSYLFDEFKEKKVVAIGWNEVGNLESYSNVEKIKEALRKEYRDDKEGRIRMTAGQLNRMKADFKKGDYVITYNSGTRMYLIGKIESEYRFESGLLEYFHTRKVDWLGEISRDDLSSDTKNRLGSIVTIFEIGNKNEKEIINLLENKDLVQLNEDEDEAELNLIKEDFSAKSHELIKDKITLLGWEQMQELVAGLLRGMGYKTRISPKGPDRGRDIQASPDGLGLEEPRIVVEVKHKKVSMGTPEIRSFTGGLRNNDKGLYVSTGGFTKEAKYEAERSNMPMTLIDGDLLVDLITQYYDNLDVETKTLLPLKKLYLPI